MRNQKMSKQVVAMVTEMNDRNRVIKNKDEYEPCTSALMWLLMQAGCYHGYTWRDEMGRCVKPSDEGCVYVHIEIV